MLRILDLGSGAVPKLISDYLEIGVIQADLKLTPAENMEQLTYPDNSFDIVVCVNALDHTKDAEAAVREMMRVSSGLVYIDCALIQRMVTGGHHYWDAHENGVFRSKDAEFDLKDFGFRVGHIDNGGERRYDHVHAVYNHTV